MAEPLRLELLLGTRVRALNGRVIGRLEEVVAQWETDNYGWIERLAAWPIALGLFRALQSARHKQGYRVRWNQLDVSDPATPRLRCKVEELEPLAPEKGDEGN